MLKLVTLEVCITIAFITLVVGFFLGVFVMCCLFVAKKSDESSSIGDSYDYFNEQEEEYYDESEIQ